MYTIIMGMVVDMEVVDRGKLSIIINILSFVLFYVFISLRWIS